MIIKRTCYFRVGIEKLDKNKRPIEHIDCDTYDLEDVEFAFEEYDAWDVSDEPYYAKYINYINEEGEEITLKSENYLTNKLYSLNDFKIGDVAYDTAFAEIRDKKLFDEFGNLIKEL